LVQEEATVSVQQSTRDLRSGLRAVRELSEFAASATRADVIGAWALACAIVGLLALVF
jgi:hypothetical protein